MDNLLIAGDMSTVGLLYLVLPLSSTARVVHAMEKAALI